MAARRTALSEIHQRQSGGSPTDADAWLADLRAEERYVEDIEGG